MKKTFIAVFVLTLTGLFVLCSSMKRSQIQPQGVYENKGLKDYYKKYFDIGVAVSPRALKTDEAQLILQQFNSMTPENAMKR